MSARWRRRRYWNARRLLLAATGTVAIIVVIAGYVQYGAWIAAVAIGLLIVDFERWDVLETRYQTRVRQALQPLSRNNQQAREQNLDLKAELERIQRLEPPPELRSTHNDIIEIVRDVIDARLRGSSDAIISYASVAVARSEKLNAYRSRIKTAAESGDDSRRRYAGEMKDASDALVAKQNMAADRHFEDIAATIASLETITPPRRRASAHKTLIETVTLMRDLTERRRDYTHSGDQAGVDRAARELVQNTERMKAAIREIRRWF